MFPKLSSLRRRTHSLSLSRALLNKTWDEDRDTPLLQITITSCYSVSLCLSFSCHLSLLALPWSSILNYSLVSQHCFFKVIRQHWSGRTRGSALWAGSSRTLSREWRERALDEREEEAERDKEREGEAKQESKQRDRSRWCGSPSLGWDTRIWVFSRSHLEKQLMGLFSWRAAHISPPIVSTWRLLSLNYGGF